MIYTIGCQQIHQLYSFLFSFKKDSGSLFSPAAINKSMKEASTRNIKIIYRGSPPADRQIRTGVADHKWNGDRKIEDPPSIEGRLDFRDEKVRIPLSFTVVKEIYVNDPTSYEESMLQWLVEVVETIFSMAFRHLVEDRLSSEQAKAWACKNVLGNIKALCEYLVEVGVGVNQQFLQQLDSFLTEIISVVIVKYPQTNAKSASRKVLRFIKQISDRDNDQYDFLFAHNHSIRYHINADYSTEIMTVMNALLNMPTMPVNSIKNASVNPAREDESLMESFTRFCRQLFYYAHQGDFTEDMQQSATFKIIDQSVDAILTSVHASPTLEQLDNLAQNRNRTEAYHDLASALVEEKYEYTEDVAAFQHARGHLFKIGQKIPSEVRHFSEKEVKEGQFKVHHSAVLRVLTKWSQQLYEKLQKAGDLIRARIHRFKTNQGLRFCSVEEKQHLYEQAVREKARVDEYLQTLKNENKILQSVFAGEHVEGKYIRRFINVDVFAGKLEELVSNHTFHYLNRLIHSLLQLPIAAGERLYEYYKYLQNEEDVALRFLKELGEVNLVTFKVGDLLRARYSCEEHEFVAVLGLLYKMEELNSGYLRIVKIKNRMFGKDNDILINFFFRSTIICELQLSIHKEENKKERLYSDFNHFIYELKRSQFGIIAEFASIVAQHDPLVNYFTFNQHTPPVIIENIRRTHLHVRSRSKELLFRRRISDGFLTHKLCQRAIERPFLCNICRHLKTVLNPKFYYREENDLSCNECIEEDLFKNPEKHGTVLKELFKYYILDDYLQVFINQVSLWDPKEALRNVRDQKQLYADFIDYGFIIEKGDKVPRVRFFKTFYDSTNNSVVLSTVINGDIDNFLSVDCKREKGQLLLNSILSHFLFFSPKTINQEELSQIRVYISQENSEQDYLKTVHLREKDFLKKQYIRTIQNSFEKYHSTLYLNGFKYILEYIYEYLHPESETQGIKRRSLFEGNSLRITSILLESSQIFTLYPFLKYFANLRELNVSHNHITSVQPLEGFRQLQILNISHNHIPSVESLSKIPSLENLIAKDNKIASLKDIALISGLKILDCSENRLVSVKELEVLINLEELILDNNKISSLEGIARLNRLRELNVCGNGLSKMEEVSDLTKLEILGLAINSIEVMMALPRLIRLTTLNLARNSIKNIVCLATKSLRELNLSKNCIEKMQNLECLVELDMLNLAGNNVKRVEGLGGLQKLKKLILTDNQIVEVQNMDQLRGLEQLKIENNPINFISNISYLKTLSSLSFDNCLITKISGLKSLKRLKSLSLAKNKIDRINDIDELVRLQRLDLSNNSIQRIENLGTLKYLQSLSLSNNSISKMENLSFLLELNWLVLSHNSFKIIQGLDELTEMRTLELEGNQIENISGLDSMDSLEELLLSSNKITVISGLDFLSNLKKLSLSRNRISSLEGLGKLTHLELLDLQMNNISRIQGLNALSQLKWLVLSGNNIECIEGLERLDQLSKLILSSNRISQIQNIGHLKVLSALYVDDNQLTRIENLDELQNLEKLHLGKNKISVIEGLGGLEQLVVLDLESNQIERMEGLSFLLKLKKLNLANNTIKTIENLESLKELNSLVLNNNQIEKVTTLHTLPFLQFVDLNNNPIIEAEAYSYNLLNENVNLTMELIIQKFDSQILRRTNHHHSAIDKSDDTLEVMEKVKMVRTFARSFQPHL